MSEEVPNDGLPNDAPEPALRPSLGSPAELSEPWIRLAMARARIAPALLPHPWLGKAALAAAILFSLQQTLGLYSLWQGAQDRAERLALRLSQPVDALAQFRFDSDFNPASAIGDFGLVLSFLMGLISLFIPRTRKVTGLWAMGVSLGFFLANLLVTRLVAAQ